MANSGFASLSEGCDKNFVANFGEVDYIVSPSGSCVLHVKEHLHDSDEIKASHIRNHIYELTEFIVDILKEHIALAEAHRLNIPTFAMVDTNSDPGNIDFVIPANDDATKSISLITGIITKAIEEGLEERKRERDEDAEKEGAAAKAAAEKETAEKPVRKRKTESAVTTETATEQSAE